MKKVTKKKLLIYWTSRTFVEVFGPLISELSEKFKIVVMVIDYSTPAGMRKLLDSWQKAGTIEEYFVTPPHNSMLRMHLFMKKIIRKLKPYGFDLWITDGEMQVGERYILECILKKECISVILSLNTTFLFMRNAELVKELLKETEMGKALALKQRARLADSFYKPGLREKIKKQRNLFELFKKATIFLQRRIRRPFSAAKRKIRFYCDRFILPRALAGKTFRLGQYDLMTQLSSGRCDAIIFCDDMEAEAHKLLFKEPRIYVARYPSYGSCRCNGKKQGKNVILSPLSGFVGQDYIPQEALFLFYRDFKTVISHTNASSIHLRSHPDETGRWHYQLQNYLVTKGIDAMIVGCNRPIREIVCDYIGVAGHISSSFRDARAACNHIFVTSFAGVSRYLFNNPKLVFGNSEGIGWIEEDGSYVGNIFIRQKHIPSKRQSVVTIVDKLLNNKDVS